jgi:hypothetical protein
VEEEYHHALVAAANIRTTSRDELLVKAAAASVHDSQEQMTFRQVYVISYAVAQELILDSAEYAAAKARRTMA